VAALLAAGEFFLFLFSISAQGPSNTHRHPLHECVKLQAAHVSERQKEILSRNSTRRG